jgi:hypothetical protein
MALRAELDFARVPSCPTRSVLPDPVRRTKVEVDVDSKAREPRQRQQHLSPRHLNNPLRAQSLERPQGSLVARIEVQRLTDEAQSALRLASLVAEEARLVQPAGSFPGVWPTSDRALSIRCQASGGT